jgi:hypothetical protein
VFDGAWHHPSTAVGRAILPLSGVLDCNQNLLPEQRQSLLKFFRLGIVLWIQHGTIVSVTPKRRANSLLLIRFSRIARVQRQLRRKVECHSNSSLSTLSPAFIHTSSIGHSSFVSSDG